MMLSPDFFSPIIRGWERKVTLKVLRKICQRNLGYCKHCPFNLNGCGVREVIAYLEAEK